MRRQNMDAELIRQFESIIRTWKHWHQAWGRDDADKAKAWSAQTMGRMATVVRLYEKEFGKVDEYPTDEFGMTPA